ncbi:hypothetical protein ACFQYP_47430 [Nonomuraea antimicrobica]
MAASGDGRAARSTLGVGDPDHRDVGAIARCQRAGGAGVGEIGAGGQDETAGAVNDDHPVVLGGGEQAGADADDRGTADQDVGSFPVAQHRVHADDSAAGQQQGANVVVVDDLEQFRSAHVGILSFR